MSSSNCCFLTCTQVSWEAGKEAWNFHLFKNIPPFVVIHTVKSFDVVNEAKVDVFLEFPCFMIQWMLAIWPLVPLPFLNPAFTSESSQFKYSESLTWRILNITLPAWEVNTIVQWVVHSLALPFFGIGVKTDLFQSCGHCWVFWICWHWVQYSNSIIF